MPAMGGSDKPEDREFSELNWVSSTSEPSPEKPEPSPEQEEGEKATPEWDEDAPTCARTLTIEEIAAADAAMKQTSSVRTAGYPSRPSQTGMPAVSRPSQAGMTAVTQPSQAGMAPGSLFPPAHTYLPNAPALTTHNAFRTEMYRLARTRDYRSITALHEAALEYASWAAVDDVHATLLLDLARLYRDRLPDRARAQRTFERLIQRRPGHEEAMKFLVEVYENQRNMAALHSLYSHAVDEEWGPERRIELTRNAARIALDHLKDPETAARDWERLLELGETDGQVTVELSRVYREAGRWADLGEFLKNRADACSDTTRVAILREAVEAFLAGSPDSSKAEALIEQILQGSPDDPVALASLSSLLAQHGRWDDLAAVAHRPMPQIPSAARLDVLRLVADLLTSAGDHERAAIAYERILQLAPGDRAAIQAREEQLRRMGDHKGLVSFLVARADRARVAADKAKLYARAAEVTENSLDDLAGAAAFWLRAIAASPDNPAAYEALVSLYERLNDVDGTTQALEGLAKTTREPKPRAGVLRRLGEHYAYKAANDVAAQRCWLEVASIMPHDLSIQRELNGIHRRRGDFAALDSALTRQLWRTSDRNQAIEVAREIAHNIDENLADADRSVRAWMHVLDLSPDDDQALWVLSDKLAARPDSLLVRGVLESRLWRAEQSDDSENRNAIALHIAQLLEHQGDRSAAVAAYERVRAWAPNDSAALDGLVRLYAESDPRAAVSVLEIAAARANDPVQATQLLSRALALCPEQANRQRFLLMRRMLRIRGGVQLEQVVQAAATAGAWSELAALYQHLERLTDSPEERRAYGQHLAEICEQRLGNPTRAYVALQALTLGPVQQQDFAGLERLAETTSRWEDLLAAIDANIGPDTPADTVYTMLAQRADICERNLQDPYRAFLEIERFIDARQPGPLTEQEHGLLERLQRLSSEHNLHRELLSVYDSLWDLATTDEDRVQVARAREAILRDHLDDASGALEQALLVLRLMPHDADVTQAALDGADRLNLWQQVLPLIEGVWRASGAEAEHLAQLAKYFEDKCGHSQHAVELLAQALQLDPSREDLQQALEHLGEQTQHAPRVVHALRVAAARSSPEGRGLVLARRVASLYADRLTDPIAAISVHRWILQVWPNELPSLQVVIDAHRNANEYADLRTALEQWVECTPEPADQVATWIEIGRICRDHLSDPAAALVAFSHVVEIDPVNEEAGEAIRSLGDVSLAPSLRRQQARVELSRTTGARRIELLSQLVELEQQLGDSEAALGVLREMRASEGGREPSLEPLTRLLRESQSWVELATLLEEESQQAQTPEVKLNHLREALEITQASIHESEREERLLRSILTISPADEEASIRLSRLLRNSQRFEDLAFELSERLQSNAPGQNRAVAQWMRRELVRVLDLALNRSKEAEALLRIRHDGEHAQAEPDDALWLAMIAARKSDHASYIEQRRRHIPKLPKRLGALVLCHLAEYCDQYMNLKGRVLALYREARALDPDNSFATDALRGLGRGVRTWRSTAALLQLPNEEALSSQDRSTQLRQLGDAAMRDNPNEALSYYERAAAVNPDDVAAWDAISAIAIDRRDTDYAWLASVEAAHAFERTTPPQGSDVTDLARRLAHTAEVASRAGHSQQTREIAEIAFAVDPDQPTSAILVADARFDAGDDKGACALYGRIVDRMSETLTAEQRAHALFRRGALSLRASQLDRAHEDLRQAIALAPFDPLARETMSDLLRAQAQPASAALHLLKALLVTRDTEARGAICRRIGVLFESDLTRTEEAGAWFEFAAEAGVVDDALKRRLLHHYRRTGRSDEALIALEDLIQGAFEPAELADLWAMRGSILADRNPDAAVEALDIALSYDPAHPEALASLRRVLEERGDHAQLVDLLDARLEAGSRAERVETLRTLADICFDKLADQARGEQYLLRLIELAPSRAAIEDLLRIVEADPSRQLERLPLIARVLGSGPPYCDRIIEVARIIYDRGERHWAWAVLSSLLGASPIDSWSKQVLVELRKAFERFDSITLLRPFVVEGVGQLATPDPFRSAFGDLCARLYVPPTDSGLSSVDARTGPGKVFERVQEGLGILGKLLRGPDSAPTLTIHRGEVPTIALRSDQLSAPPGELAWLCSYGLMLARPACISLAVVPETERPALVPALASAYREGDFHTDDPTVAALASLLCQALSPEELGAWKSSLVDLAQAQAQAQAAFADAERAAVRVATVAAGDLRTAARALARLSSDARRPPGVGRIEEFEAYFASIPSISFLLEFAASEDFGRLLRASG